jgi:hypothetical protein
MTFVPQMTPTEHGITCFKSMLTVSILWIE